MSVFCTVFLCGLFAGALTATGAGGPSSPDRSKLPLHIEVQDAQAVRLVGPETHPSSSKTASAALVFDREYQPGDRIVLSGPARMAVRVDETMPECLLYILTCPPRKPHTSKYDFTLRKGEGAWRRVSTRKRR